MNEIICAIRVQNVYAMKGLGNDKYIVKCPHCDTINDLLKDNKIGLFACGECFVPFYVK